MKELYELSDKIKNSKCLVIFGTGKHAKETYVQLINRGLKPDYFADRNDLVTGLKLFGIEIISERELAKLDCQIIIASSYWKDIEKRLLSINKKDIFVDTNRYLNDLIEV